MSSNNKTLVQLNNAGFRQNGKWLVEGVSLKVEKGKIVTLIGPNGSGKSTTAKIALGIYKNIDTALTREPFDKRELMKAFNDLKENFQNTQTEMHSMMTEFSAQLTTEQRKILVNQAKHVYEKRHERLKRRLKRFKETEDNK